MIAGINRALADATAKPTHANQDGDAATATKRRSALGALGVPTALPSCRPKVKRECGRRTVTMSESLETECVLVVKLTMSERMCAGVTAWMW